MTIDPVMGRGWSEIVKYCVAACQTASDAQILIGVPPGEKQMMQLGVRYSGTAVVRSNNADNALEVKAGCLQVCPCVNLRPVRIDQQRDDAPFRHDSSADELSTHRGVRRRSTACPPSMTREQRRNSAMQVLDARLVQVRMPGNALDDAAQLISHTDQQNSSYFCFNRHDSCPRLRVAFIRAQQVWSRNHHELHHTTNSRRGC